MLKDLFTSKKFITALVTVIVVILNKALGINLDETTITNLVIVAVGYVVGQGLADLSKETNKN